MVDRRRKNKKKHWLRRPIAVPKKKRNLNQNINYLKSHIWNSFFENSISGIQSFYSCPDVPVDAIREFFFNFKTSSRKSQKQQKLAKKITHFTIQFR